MAENTQDKKISGTEENNPAKKRKNGILKRIYVNNKKFILAMLFLLILGNMGILVKKHFFSKEENINYLFGMEVQDFDEYILTLKDKPSDIEGYSLYDKYAMGLQKQDGSDSDYDGLTDKEEIEIYGTDPLKSSTSGDLYSDSYKVNNGMDLFTFYEYKETMLFENNECPEIILTAKAPTDFSAVVKECAPEYLDLSQFGIDSCLKGYNLYNYGSQVKIDLNSILSSIDDCEIYVSQGAFVIKGLTELEKCQYNLTNNIASIDYDFDVSEIYYIFVAEKDKKNFINSIFSKKTATTYDHPVISGDDEAIAFSCGFPLLNFLGATVKVDYTECILEKNTESFKAEVSNYLNEDILGGNRDYVKEYKPIKKGELEIKKAMFDKFLGVFEFIPGEKESLWNILFYYTTYSASYNSNPYYKQVNTGFDKYVDEFSFQNFGSYISPGGNCAGISHFVSFMYNRGFFPTSGFYDCFINDNVETIYWNISNHLDNSTLLDSGIFDYKNSDFINERVNDEYVLVDEYLTDGEKEFVNMIGCVWAETNNYIHVDDYKIDNTEKYGTPLIYNMLHSIDEGKILEAAFLLNNGSAHAVNIYGYEWVSENTIYFYVYDSNMPQDKYVNDYYKKDTCTLCVSLYSNPENQDYFEYVYWPDINDYGYLSTTLDFMEYTSLAVWDENYNILN